MSESGTIPGAEPALWRSLDELRGRAPQQLAPPRDIELDPVARREFLRLTGASLALAGLGSCTRQPVERVLPWARSPESTVPGEPLHFATCLPLTSGAFGLLAESHDGRPTKLEGNPDHPASLGASDAQTQATLLGLYDPDRSQVVLHNGAPSTFDAFELAFGAALERHRAQAGRGLALLCESVVSPSLAAWLERARVALPELVLATYEPVNRDRARAGALLAFGRDLELQPDFGAADALALFECDALAGARGVVATRALARRRAQPREGERAPRLYAIESSPTQSGTSADHRLALTPARCEHALRLLALELGLPLAEDERPAPLSAHAARFIAALARDLVSCAPRSLVCVGEALSPASHALAHRIHAHLKSSAARTAEPVAFALDAERSQGEQLAHLVSEMRAGRVESLLVLGANPVHAAPPELEFSAALESVPLRAHLGLYRDETAERCHWHLPQAHFLESWGDARGVGGSVGFVQPLIAPLYGGRNALELVAWVAGMPAQKAYELVRAHWNELGLGGAQFEAAWRRALHDGAIAAEALRATPELARQVARPLELPVLREHALGAPPTFEARGLELALREDVLIGDGRYANNAWLQELPHPVTTQTWGNAALVAPATASRLGVHDGDFAQLALGGRRVRAPVLVLPGQAEDCITLSLGYGRARAGQIGDGVGVDANPLRSAQHPWGTRGLHVERSGSGAKLALTQTHHSMEGRDLVRSIAVADFLAGATGAPAHLHVPEHDTSMYPAWPRGEQAWGMVIDLARCTGCNACVIGCQSENNIPVVGAAEVAKGRELHWLRVDRYFSGTPEEPELLVQPVTCMHCENAPCEVVCPVGATVHGPEGLNEMVYNRCIGTRYCSNNCPYKVRRFNFLSYADLSSETLALQRNTDVTVRTRGVMEKCTYCVQRINEARIDARKQGREVADGEIRTACQQACPAEAIVFGDVDDPTSQVSRLRSEKRHYGLLEELNVKPRTTYLARLRNPNPELAEPGEARAPETPH